MAISKEFLKNGCGALSIVTFMMYVIVNSVPMWSELTGLYTAQTFGLWSFCKTYMNKQVCEKMPCSGVDAATNLCQRIPVAQAFVTLACIFSGVCAILLIVFRKINGNIKRLLLLAAKFCATVTFLFGIIGVVIGVHTTMHPTNEVVYAMALGAVLGIIAIPISLTNAIFFLLFNE